MMDSQDNAQVQGAPVDETKAEVTSNANVEEQTVEAVENVENTEAPAGDAPVEEAPAAEEAPAEA